MIQRQPLQFFEKQNTLELILIYDLLLIPGGTDIFGKCLEKYQEKKEERRASVEQSCGTDEENSNDGNEKSKKFATQIGDLSALDADLRNGEEDEPKLKLAGFSDFGGENIQSETLHKVTYQFKVKQIVEDRLDLIPSPSPSLKIQIMGGKICPYFEFLLKVMGLNADYLLKSFLLYLDFTEKNKALGSGSWLSSPVSKNMAAALE